MPNTQKKASAIMMTNTSPIKYPDLVNFTKQHCDIFFAFYQSLLIVVEL